MVDLSNTPCQVCNHRKKDHSMNFMYCIPCGMVQSKVTNPSCMHSYKRIENLEYLEWLYNQRRKEMDETPKMSDEQLKEMAKFEEETTKDVAEPLAISPEILKEVKEHKRERTELEKQVDVEIIAEAEHLATNPEELKKHVDAIENDPEAIHIPGKKDKKLTPKSFYCSTCREWFLEDKADKRPMGFNRTEDGTILTTASRFSIFCPSCAKFISIQDPETDAKIKNAIDKVGNK